MTGKEILYRHQRRTSTSSASRPRRRLQKCLGGFLALYFFCTVSLVSLGVASATDVNDVLPQQQHETLRQEDTASHGTTAELLDVWKDFQTRLLGKQKVRHPGNPSQKQKPTRQQTTQSPVVQGGVSRKRTRRRALYELTIAAHYHPPPQTGLNSSLPSSTVRPSSTGEQPHTLTPNVFQDKIEEQCVFYNPNEEEEGDELSYWTYRLCPGKSVTQIHVDATPEGVELLTLPNGKIQAEIIPMEEATLDEKYFEALFHRLSASLIEHNLGNFVVSKKTNEELEHLLKLHWDLDNISIKEMNEVSFYVGGGECIVSNNVEVDGEFKKQNVRRNRMTAVLHDTQCCTAEDSKTQQHFVSAPFKISSVTETVQCYYVIRTCRDCSYTGNVESEEDRITPDVTGENEREKEMWDDDFESSLAETKQIIETYLHRSSSEMGDAILLESDPLLGLVDALPPMPQSRIQFNLGLIREMFEHAYDSYMYNAFPGSELKPLSCTPGTFNLVKLPSLTLIDTLDTLAIMGNYTEFARSVERLRSLDKQMRNEFLSNYGENSYTGGLKAGLFSVDKNVSVFETNIRVLGGLLSAHQLAHAYVDGQVLDSEVWDQDGSILLGKDKASHTRDEGLDRGLNDDKHKGDAPLPTDACVCESVDKELLNSHLCPYGPTVHHQSLSYRKRLCSNVSNSTASEQKIDRKPPKRWSYDGLLLQMAHDLGVRLLKAFATKTGIPYGTVNLLYGIPPKETTIASLAGGGTLSIEMELLSRLTGDDSFGKAAKLASRALWLRRSPIGLLGKHIDINSGRWTESLSGIGSNSDSFYEYLIKHYALFPDDDDFWMMMTTVYSGIFLGSRLSQWYLDSDMSGGVAKTPVRAVFESLMAFYPGMQILMGEVTPAAKTLNSFFLVREFMGFLPERFNIEKWQVDGNGGDHPLRPELLESCYFLHMATRGLGLNRHLPNEHGSETKMLTSGWLWAADFALHALHSLAWTKCGFPIIKNVSPSTTGSIAVDLLHYASPPEEQQKRHNVKMQDEMPSFFLSETLKYLFLTFDETNILHTDDDREWIFTTEAHPMHHVAVPASSTVTETSSVNSDDLNNMKDRVIEMLKERISTFQEEKGTLKVMNNSSTLLFSDEPVLEVLQQKWTPVTAASLYQKQIIVAEKDIIKGRDAINSLGVEYQNSDLLSDSKLVRPFVQLSTEPDVFNIQDCESRTRNIAFLMFEPQGMGHGPLLSKSCPNYHHPSFQWLHALSGGATDYADIFMTSTSDELGFHQNSQYVFLQTALSSVASYGVQNHFDKAEQCLLKDVLSLDDTDNSSPPLLKEELDDNKAPPGAQRFDMGGSLGEFDLLSFQAGNGFSVKHINSGELVDISIFYTDGNTDTPGVEGTKDASDVHEMEILVSSLIPFKDHGDVQKQSLRKSFGKWRSIFNSETEDVQDKDINDVVTGYERTVVVADGNDNSFACTVDIVRRLSIERLAEAFPKDSTNTLSDISEEQDVQNLLLDERDEHLLSIPCSPALFGPTSTASLVERGGIIIGGSLQEPRASDEFGCGSEKDESDQGSEQDPVSSRKKDPVVQILRRGGCFFEDKCKRERTVHGSDAVIIINSEPEKFFIMTSTSGNYDTVEDVPVSVLVNGNDGEEMMRLIKNEHLVTNEQFDGDIVMTSEIVATIRLSDESPRKDQVQSSTPTKWPVVRTTPDSIRVFASNGWGFQAVQTKEGQDSTSDGWQLHMLNHDMNPAISTTAPSENEPQQ